LIIPYTYFLRVHGACDRSAEDAYSSVAPDTTSGISRGPYKPDFHCGLFHATDFDCGLFRSTNLDTLNMTTAIRI
jgi:hypothetical protein